ncbi:hypothetical protein [Streptomyces griseus]|uniref:hypothetical protein n=1 Tax=Streptomyces griseus TaxID=1911 RepID=UPI0004C9B903|nr:hypothetical protein [Streptomyces griseus]
MTGAATATATPRSSRTGRDPRELAAPSPYFLVGPRRVRARREAGGPAGRTPMRDGTWLS